MIKYLDFKSKRKFFQTQVYPALLNAGLYDKAKKIALCGSSVKILECTDCYAPHFDGAYNCKDKFCPVCQKKRSLLWLTKMIPICDELLSRGYRMYMLTYTIRTNKNQSLKECLNLLNCGFRYMTNGHRRYTKVFNDLILGGVRSLEVKLGEDHETKEITGIWHPHLHMLVCVKSNMPFRDLHKLLSDMWNDCLNTINRSEDLYLGSVNIRSIKANSNRQALLDQLCEVFKYMTKFDWQNTDKVYEMVTTLHKVKMQISFGNFKSLLSEKQIEFEMNKSISEIEKDLHCAVCGGSDFAEVFLPYSSNINLYDVETKYSDLNTNDLILNEYMESEDNE